MRAWQIAVVGVMAIALISTSLILVRQTQPTISDEIFYMKASIEDSVEAIKAEDPNAAKIYVSEVWSSLNKAKGLIETENESKNETKNFKTALRMYDDIYKILIRLHFLSKEAIGVHTSRFGNQLWAQASTKQRKPHKCVICDQPTSTDDKLYRPALNPQNRMDRICSLCMGSLVQQSI